jgi:hypothetical protein
MHNDGDQFEKQVLLISGRHCHSKDHRFSRGWHHHDILDWSRHCGFTNDPLLQDDLPPDPWRYL